MNIYNIHFLYKTDRENSSVKQSNKGNIWAACISVGPSEDKGEKDRESFRNTGSCFDGNGIAGYLCF